jgi:hypothetical protein
MAKKALVIGISKFDQFANLNCDRDLERMSQWLNKQDYDVTIAPERFDSNTLTTQPNQTGRLVHDELEAVLGRFLTETVRGCELAVVYIASHGCIKRKSFGQKSTHLVASNTCKDPINQSIDLADLAGLFRDAPVDNLVGIFDFCHAGAIEDLVPDLQNVFLKKNYALLAACQPSEGARDTPDGGVFTTALLEGLQPEQAKRGEITVRQLCDFVQDRLQSSGQNPFCFSGRDRLVLGRYDPSASQPTTDRNRSTDQPSVGRVLVMVEKHHQLPGKYHLYAWVQIANDYLEQLVEVDPAPMTWAELSIGFETITNQIYTYQNDPKTQCNWSEYQIEVFLPLDLISQGIEQTRISDEGQFLIPLSSEFPVVVRLVERLPGRKYKRRKRWEQKSQQLRTVHDRGCATDHLQLAQYNSSEELTSLREQLGIPEVIGFRCSQPLKTIGEQNILDSIIPAGLPVAVWIRSEATDLNPQTWEQDLNCLIAGPLSTLSDRVYKARCRNNPVAKNLSLLWDDHDPTNPPLECLSQALSMPI